jgi:hypothetical protein
MRGTSNAQFGAAPLPPRARPPTLMYHREYPITPSQQATNGALDIFVEGCRHDNVRQQLFGLSVLRSATAEQVEAAMPIVQRLQRVTHAEIMVMFAR